MIDRYRWAGGEEAMLRFGAGDGPAVIVALPPFEEANRMRAFATSLLRRLADHGIAGALPDLPGTGESRVETAAATLADWRTAFAAAARAADARYGVAIRAGALIDDDAALASRWRLAPQPGAQLVRELDRIRQAAEREDGAAAEDAATVTIAGNRIGRPLLDALAAASLGEMGCVRTVRMASDAQPADLKLDAAPLWRRAEPDNDAALVEACATDIADWVRACAG